MKGTIIGLFRTGTQVYAQYKLSNGEDGQFPISVGDTPETISTMLQTIVDTANYVESLKPMVGVQVGESKPAPSPVVVAEVLVP